MKKDTRIHLVQELEALQGAERNPVIDEMIKEAKAGEFHDYKSVNHICGKTAAVEYLRQAAIQASAPECAGKLMELRKRVMDGEFDEEMDEADEKALQDDLKGLFK